MKTSREILLFRGYQECFREKYPSRKNEVAMCCAMNQDCYNLDYVMKTVSDPAFEVSMLKHFADAGVNVPTLMALDPDTIMMEYIQGIALNELLNKYENSGDDISAVMNGVREWLAAYHTAAQSYEGKKITSKGDLALTNFLYTPDGKVFGFDFEDGDYDGSLEGDMHIFAANILTQEPMFTDYKKNAAKILLGSDYDKVKLAEALGKVKAEQGLEINTEIDL